MKRQFSIRKIVVAAICHLTALLFSACGILPDITPIPREAIHGEDLLALSNDEISFEVYRNLLDLADTFPTEADALSEMSPQQRTVYILNIYDMEMQNGGLCQFFVNSSRCLAPDLDACLETVGAEEHRQLLAEFVSKNNIDLQDLDSFKIFSIQDYTKQTERYDFDSYDNTYYMELPPLSDYIANYIKANITHF